MTALIHGSASHPVARRDSAPLESLACLVLGGALLARALRSRSWGGVVMGIASSGLLYQGLRGLQQLAPSQREQGAGEDATSVERSVTIGKPADELHRLWSEPRALSQIMGHFVELSGESMARLHWRVSVPLGQELEWDTRVVEDRPGELLRWESVEGAPLPNQGVVRFRPAPGNRGTEVTLHLHFSPPGGALGEAVMKRLLVVPGQLALRALRRFKSLAETGEIPTIERNPSARKGHP